MSRSTEQLRHQITEIAQKARLDHVAVAFHDLASGERFAHEGERLFHAASTFKAAVLLALLRIAMEGSARLGDHLQVRNRFLGVTDQRPYRIDRERDGDAKVHRFVGRSLTLRELAHAMITRSSNLATNLLLDFLTVERVNSVLKSGGIEGVLVRRGVEDMVAHEQGINNEATAEGLAALFLAFVRDDFLSAEMRREGLGILLEQEFQSMIPSRLPRDARVANKTGEISTHTHDAGLVLINGREPYAVAILTASAENAERRPEAVAQISELVYEHLIGEAA